MRGRGTLLALGSVAVLALIGGHAHAAVECGEVIEQDLKLKQDLTACPDEGLVAGAANITINLNGHRIDGQDLVGTSGVYVPGSFTHVVLKGPGRITDFEHGVQLRGDNARVRKIRSKSNQRGISVNEAADAKVRGNTIVGSTAYGVSVSHAGAVEISGNEITGPSVNLFTSAGLAVSGSDAPNTLFEDNVVRGGPEGDVGIWVFGDALSTKIKFNEFRGFGANGMDIYDGATNTLVKKNKAINNGLDGIQVDADAGSGTKVKGNTARENSGDGIDVDKSGVQIGDNTATNNNGWGIIATAPADLGGNEATGNGQGQCSGVACN